METSTSQAGEIFVIKVVGAVTDPDVPDLVGAIQTVLNTGGLNLVLDFEAATSLCPAALAGLLELGRKVAGGGGGLVLAGGRAGLYGDFAAALEADPQIRLAESRGHGMSMLLDRISVRGELLRYVQGALETSYATLARPEQAVACRFVKNIQNFLVFALTPPYDGGLQKGMRLRFRLGGCGDEGLHTVSFDAQIYRFASLKDGTPCLMVKVPDILEVQEDRREDPRVRVQLRCSFYERNRPERKGYGQLVDISENGCSLVSTNFPYPEGQLVVIEPEFRNFKLIEPLQVVVVYLGREGGQARAGLRFEYVNPQDRAQISRMILFASKA